MCVYIYIYIYIQWVKEDYLNTKRLKCQTTNKKKQTYKRNCTIFILLSTLPRNAVTSVESCTNWLFENSPHGVMVKLLDYNLLVNGYLDAAFLVVLLITFMIFDSFYM